MSFGRITYRILDVKPGIGRQTIVPLKIKAADGHQQAESTGRNQIAKVWGIELELGIGYDLSRNLQNEAVVLVQKTSFDADRGDTFFAVFLLVVLAFLAAFLRVAVARESFQRRFIIQN
jgi:hypothetical protein